MRRIIKHFIINSISLYAVSLAVSGIYFSQGVYSILLAGISLTLATMVIEPIINIFLLPINLLTFGLFRWVGFAVTLYLVTLVVPGFEITNFAFGGYSSYWFNIPVITLAGVLAFIAYSFVISLISTIAYWIFK